MTTETCPRGARWGDEAGTGLTWGFAKPVPEGAWTCPHLSPKAGNRSYQVLCDLSPTCPHTCPLYLSPTPPLYREAGGQEGGWHFSRRGA